MKKKLTNKDFEKRTNILMAELSHAKQDINRIIWTLSKFIKYSGSEEEFMKYLEQQREADDVRSELQESSG